MSCAELRWLSSAHTSGNRAPHTEQELLLTAAEAASFAASAAWTRLWINRTILYLNCQKSAENKSNFALC